MIGHRSNALGVANGRSAELLDEQRHEPKLPVNQSELEGPPTSIAAVPNQKRARQKAARRQKLEAQRRAARKNQMIRRTLIVVLVAAVVIGSVAFFVNSGPSKPTTTSTTSTSAPTTTTTLNPNYARQQAASNRIAVAAGCPSNPYARVNTLSWKSAPPMTISKTTTYYAHVTTTLGNFVIQLNTSKAPITVNNFVFLADQKYYNCVIFHRVITGELIQGGDPSGTGTGANNTTPGYTIPDELPPTVTSGAQYPKYSVAMANESSPHTGNSQFFIVMGPQYESLPPSYSLFGQVISGFATVNAITADGSAAGVPPNVTQRMLKVTISTTA